jgi:hypothetical protein
MPLTTKGLLGPSTRHHPTTKPILGPKPIPHILSNIRVAQCPPPTHITPATDGPISPNLKITNTVLFLIPIPATGLLASKYGRRRSEQLKPVTVAVRSRPNVMKADLPVVAARRRILNVVIGTLLRNSMFYLGYIVTC